MEARSPAADKHGGLHHVSLAHWDVMVSVGFHCRPAMNGRAPQYCCWAPPDQERSVDISV